jgi:ABC-type glycerol-3-phosphate transport system substrate-binding protein
MFSVRGLLDRGVTLAVLAVFAFQSSAVAAAETITLYYWGTDNDVLALDQIQRFEETHNASDGRPAIKVIMGQTASLDRTGDPQRLLCSITGGDPPDLENGLCFRHGVGLVCCRTRSFAASVEALANLGAL